MKNGVLTGGFIVFLLASAAAYSATANPAADNAAIRALAQRQEAAWNRHDAKAYAALFTADCDVVNVVGNWWSGRAEVERKLTTAYTSAFRHSTLTFTNVQMRYLTPQLAIAHLRWAMTGAEMPAGLPQPRQGIQILVVRKQAGEWLIDAFQNTNTVPEAERR
jgi:uncharacterized protein (TIGR02246 family)